MQDLVVQSIINLTKALVKDWLNLIKLSKSVGIIFLAKKL